jgi:hypothetical protein
LFGLTIDETSPLREIIFTFLLLVVILTIMLIRICYKKSENPLVMGTEKENKDE